jgi:hypothetical protein
LCIEHLPPVGLMGVQGENAAGIDEALKVAKLFAQKALFK